MATANLVVLDRGTCLLLNEDEEIELFHSETGKRQLDLITDSSLRGDMQLFSRGNDAMIVSGDTLYGIKLS